MNVYHDTDKSDEITAIMYVSLLYYGKLMMKI